MKIKAARAALIAVTVSLTSCSSALDEPAPQAAPAPDPYNTIEVEVRENDRLALFLFAFNASRAMADREIRSRIAIADADLDLLREHSAAFVPLRTAFGPYLDKHPLFDRTMLLMGGNLAGADVEFPDPEMLAALEAFLPVYRAHFLPRHREFTSSMRETLEEQIAAHGDAMASEVARAVESRWRENDPIRLDLVPYVTRAGAYTNSHHTVMSAIRQDYRNHALEMVYHEAAHTSPMTDAIKAIAEAALEKNGIEGERFWHYLQFYAIGRAAQSVLGDDYVPYHEASGLSSRGGARIFYEAIDAVWDEHDTLSARADAAAALVAASRNQ